MLFSPSHLRAAKPVLRRPKNSPVFCIGRHAFVHWPRSGGNALSPVPTTDGAGVPIANDLVDGQEVEIVSWRPRAREGVAYQIRRNTDGSEWWLAVIYLRRLREAPPLGVAAGVAQG